ncbi:MAG: response regulator transcription factor [Clostridia bacterium]|jgi:two-component system response regulator protein GraR
MKKILIIEDEETIRNELKTLLENFGYKVLMLEKFTNAKEDIKSMTLDLILLDINLPNINGEMLLKEIRKESNIPVIMVTSRVCEVDEVLSMSYGADDYITKPYNPTILLLRIQNIFKRMENNRDDLFYDDIVVNPKKGILEKNGKVLELTKNEMIIFTYLLNNRGRIVNRDDLMTDLWNNNEFINDNALTVNISRLRNKLQDFGLENKIETRKGQGYKLL